MSQSVYLTSRGILVIHIYHIHPQRWFHSYCSQQTRHFQSSHPSFCSVSVIARMNRQSTADLGPIMLQKDVAAFLLILQTRKTSSFNVGSKLVWLFCSIKFRNSQYFKVYQSKWVWWTLWLCSSLFWAKLILLIHSFNHNTSFWYNHHTEKQGALHYSLATLFANWNKMLLDQ